MDDTIGIFLKFIGLLRRRTISGKYAAVFNRLIVTIQVSFFNSQISRRRIQKFVRSGPKLMVQLCTITLNPCISLFAPSSNDPAVPYFTHILRFMLRQNCQYQVVCCGPQKKPDQKRISIITIQVNHLFLAFAMKQNTFLQVQIAL